MRRVFVAAAILMAVSASRTGAQTIKMDIPAGLTLSTATEPSPKKESKAGKGFLKEFKPGTCTPATPLSPPSSWPARGEPLFSVCRS